MQIFGCLPKCQNVHFVTDSYKDNSIKQAERSRRGQSVTFCVGGPKSKLPRDYASFMQNAENKRQLIKLLLSEWSSCKYAQRLHGRTLHFVDEENCWIIASDGNLVTCRMAADLCSDHEEADTRIILHCIEASKLAAESMPVIVRSPDTDLLILLLFYSSSISQCLYLDTGTGNKRRLLDIKAIAGVLGSDLCASLPAYHAFTGSDYTSAFVRKGKVRPFGMMQKNAEVIAALKNVGSTPTFDISYLHPLEQFVCAMFGKPRFNNVNTLRFKLFQSRYDVKDAAKCFQIPDGLDLCFIPPCRSSLEMHAKRVNYVSYMWKHAHIPYLQLPSPIGLGWTQVADGTLNIQWTKGDLLPQQLVDILPSDSSSVNSSVESAVFSKSDDDGEELIEDECEVDNILDIVFEDDDDDECE